MAGQKRVVLYRWAMDLSEKGVLHMKEIADQYEQLRERYGWITVASIQDKGNYHMFDRLGIKRLVRLVQEGKVDAIYVDRKDQLIPYMTEIEEFQRILCSNSVHLLDRDNAVDAEVK